MTPLRLLLIEDSGDDAALVVQELTRARYAVTFERVDTPEALAAALQSQRWDVAIADYTMPRFSGTAALALLREYDAELPFIFVSGTIGEDAVVAAMQTGAQDCIRKGDLTRLVPAVQRHLRDVDGRIARPRVEAHLAHLAYHDALTDLPNRVLLHDRLRQAILAAQRAHESLAVLTLGVDGLDAIDATLGQQAGDRVIQEIATRLRGLLREVDTVARLGDHQFALLLPGTNSSGAVLAARKVREHASRPCALDGRPVRLDSSIGIVAAPEHGSNPDELLHKGDLALRAAKSGRLGFAVYSPDTDGPAHLGLATVPELRDGIAHAQFSFDYQPIVHLQTGRVLCVEALARWSHPRRGRLPPSEFIEFAETTWLIEPLTMQLLDRAIAEWAGQGRIPWVSVAVNLSSKSLRDPDFPDRIADLLRLYGASPSSLVLEIAENAVALDTPRTAACLSRLRDMGVRLAIDDFGAGPSAMSYVRRLPIDWLKIGRSLVAGLARGDEALVRSVVDLAQSLELLVVAEGVESAAVGDRLRALRCDAAQGYYIRQPASGTDTRRWVARRNAVPQP